MENLIPIEFENQRIISTKVLAEQFGTNEQNISRNFTRNSTRFIEGKHYFKLEGEDLKSFKGYVQNDDSLKFVSVLYLWTEKGAARHAKILETEEAWEVYERLEETYFNVKEAKQLSPMDQLKLQLKVLEEQDKKIEVIGTKVENLESNMPLFNIECKELQALVKSTGTKALGGYKSPAYNDNSLRGKVYADIQRELKRQFAVNRYEAIKRSQLEVAKGIVEGYKLPLVLENEINSINSQIAFSENAI